jgi:hypothetical protein
VPLGHGFDSHPDSQGVCRSILLEPSGMGGGLGYHVYDYRFDLIDLLISHQENPKTQNLTFCCAEQDFQ